jgi:hypothetical protein
MFDPIPDGNATAILRLAFPDSCGRWHVVPAVADIVEGIYHKIHFAGFETRSGESFGISATFHEFDELFRDGAEQYGRVWKIVLENGRRISAELVGTHEPIASIGLDPCKKL